MSKPSDLFAGGRGIRILAAMVLIVAVSTLGLPSRVIKASPASEQDLGEVPGEETVPTNDVTDIARILGTANRAYLDGKYLQAAKGYEMILAGGHINGHVYYNLGNCYVRLGQFGKAILNYRQAKLLIPRDGDLEANLQYARSLSRDRIEAESTLWRTLAFWHYGMNFRELLMALAVFNALFWTSALVRLFRDREWIKWALALSLLLALTMATSASKKYWETFHNDQGVIIAREAPVRAGFDHKDTILFVLHEGAEFRILDKEKGWCKIELSDGKKGWLPATSAGEVSL